MRLERYAIATLGQCAFRLRSVAATSTASACASAGNDALGFFSASFTHAVATCAGVTPAAASRVSIVDQTALLGSAHASAACPPCAQSTSTSAGSLPVCAFAIGTNVENSCVVFDIPTETNTYFP